jgi:RNA polymerase sigma-70 factor (ECF subfamily)
VLAAFGSTPDASRALAELCEAYWHPTYAFVRRNGFDPEDARDVTQAFFARVLERGYLKDPNPERGRFRSFLLGALRHFLANERDWRRAIKRGGALFHVPIDRRDDDEALRVEPADTLTPETIYEQQWARAVLELALASTARRYEERGRGRLFDTLKPTLTGDETSSYPALAHALGMNDGALRVAIHRLRKDFGASLRATIAETVAGEDEVDAELRYLLGVIDTSA